MSRFGRLCVALGCLCLQLLAAGTLLPGSAVSATPRSPDSLGVNFIGAPPDLATASAAGAGLARYQVIAGRNMDPVVALAAAAHLRLYPMMGLPRSQGAAADATAMAAFVTTFAQRYGPGGTFWTENPLLPYLPVESYEIGNEPDITPTAPADETSLHYANPADYAQVYETARTALHQIDPSGQAVVGGMLDSGAISLNLAEQYLAAIGPVDAVGYHPYLYNVTTMEQDTLALRAWLDANGHTGVPLDINEFDAPVGVSDWGAQTSQYTQWALCTPSLDVENVLAYWWGAIPMADGNPWSFMVNSELSETSLGSAYLSEVQALTTQGCPPAASAAPASTTTTVKRTTKTTLKRKPVKRKGRGKAVKAAHHKKTRRRHPRKAAPGARRTRTRKKRR
jgi:hypothetical protein